MDRISRRRALILLGIFLVIICLYAGRLYKLQIIETDGNTDNTTTYTTITRVKAARGDILDRNGNILVGNRASYDLVFNHYVITSSDNTNESLIKLIRMCRDLGVETHDHLPITLNRPYIYRLDEFTTAWHNYFQKYLLERDIDSDITAPLLMERFREHYKIPDDWSDEDARAVIGLRYEFDLRGVVNLSNYILAEDLSDENLSAILELNIPGLMVEASTKREYYTDYAAHILGTMGAMSDKQWAAINAAYEEGTGKQYYMDAQIGQSGFESAFESYLSGVDGSRIDVVSKDGTMISSEYKKGFEPQAGNNVETTIDINLQMVAEDSLHEIIEYLKDPESEPTDSLGEDVEGASVVVMAVKTGEVLACASYPTYSLRDYNAKYDEIIAQDFDPLFNRPLLGTYYPGSTYKMTTLVAAMNAGLYKAGEEIVDQGVFVKDGWEGFNPKCLVYSAYGYTHGSIDAHKALEVSCNYFFYELGYRMVEQNTTGYSSVDRGLQILDSTAQALGFGELTGVELGEAKGYRANKESKIATHKGLEATFFKGDLVQACIGQSTTMVTPMQMCVYASTLANEGTRMKATFLNRVVSSDYRTLVLENQPKIANIMELSAETVATYKQGMKQVITGSLGTARNTMRGTPVEVCAKTGTAQTGRQGSDDGYFVCFAPADDPVIAIAVHGEKAAHGATLGRVAKSIIEYYFSTDDKISDVVIYENKIG